ncbi:MAG: ATP-binding cassette domain-containing protein, partial [Anaerolineaceae bacterium]
MLAVQDLNVFYGAIHALKGISFHLEQGEIVTLIGANGAGKSTTLNALSGILPSQSGKVIFEGADITRMPAPEIVRMGIVQVPEGRKIFATLTVMENLEIGAYTQRDKTQIQDDIEYTMQLFPRLKER